MEVEEHKAPTEFRVELDSGLSPLRGRLLCAGQEIRFSGWLGLASAIDRLVVLSMETGTSGHS